MPADRTTYNKFTWVNNESKLNANNLNHIEDGVAVNNALAKENANYIDEICSALVEYFSVSYNHEYRSLSITIGDETNTSRFYKVAAATITNNFYDKGQIDTFLLGKQAALESTVNIKTIAGQSVLGSGNISFDAELNSSSDNAPKTKVVKAALDEKLNKSSNTSSVYVVNNSGDQATLSYDTDAAFGYIPKRDGVTGDIKVPTTPKGDAYAASKSYVDSHHDSTKQDTLQFDDAPTQSSQKLVKSGALFAALNLKQDKLTAGAGISIDANGVITNTGSSTQISVTIVSTLPGAGSANVIYLVPASDSSTGNLYDEFMYINNAWERIGSAQIDLSSYYTKSEVNTLLGGKQATLVSGTDIKTINSQSILGSGNINIEAGAKQVTGEELEDMEYVAGQLYYCTSGSDSFSANTLYLAKGASEIYSISTSNSAISTTPAITAFSISPTSTEAGNAVTPTYSYTLKKYSSIRNVKLDNVLVVATPSSSQGSGSCSSSDGKTYTLTAEYGTNGSLSKTATLTTTYRQFYGVVSGSTVSEVLANLKNVTSSVSNLKTYLYSGSSKPSSVSLSLGSTPVYVYFVVKSSASISTVKSGGFDVPFSLLDTQTFTNSYNSQYSVKVYRTDNKVFGDMDISIS